MTETVVLKVGMSCQGCVGAVKRVLSKMEGVESFDVDLKEQKVTVKGNLNPEAVLQTVSRTGKKTEFWKIESEPKDAALVVITESKEKEAAPAASESEAKEAASAPGAVAATA